MVARSFSLFSQLTLDLKGNRCGKIKTVRSNRLAKNKSIEKKKRQKYKYKIHQIIRRRRDDGENGEKRQKIGLMLSSSSFPISALTDYAMFGGWGEEEEAFYSCQ